METLIYNIVAVFRGMHLSPAKHRYACLPRKCDYRTDTGTDRQTQDNVIPMCRYALQVTQQANFENGGPSPMATNLNLKQIKGQGHGMMPMERARHKGHAKYQCFILILQTDE